MKIVRLITYESADEERMHEQMRKSLRPDGSTRSWNVDIRVDHLEGPRFADEGTKSYDSVAPKEEVLMSSFDQFLLACIADCVEARGSSGHRHECHRHECPACGDGWVHDDPVCQGLGIGDLECPADCAGGEPGFTGAALRPKFEDGKPSPYWHGQYPIVRLRFPE